MRTKHLDISLVGRTAADVVWLILAYAIVGFSLVWGNVDPDTDWFRRSGSVMILLAVIVEYQNATLQQRINEKATIGSGTVGGGVAPLDQPGYRRWIVNIAHITIVVGTMIAGYGDVFVNGI